MLAVSTDELRRRQDDIAVSDVTSLNTLVISDDETTVERIDTLAATDARLDPEQAATVNDAKDKFRRAFDTLPQREREVMEMRYGLKGHQARTLEEVGRAFGVTRERIRQIENNTLKKLECLPEAQRLRDAS